jgi:hypothetical protein
MNKLILLIFSIFFLAGCQKEQPGYPLMAAIAAPDADCDTVTDSLDLCPGIDDKIDNNNDGKPDCAFPPSYNKVIPRWKCGTPSLQKVFICFKTNSGGKVTICTYYAGIQNYMQNGSRLGICGEKSCPTQ